MENKIVFILILLVSVLLLVGCTNGCRKNGECVIQDNLSGTERVQYNNCVMLLCAVSNSHLDNPHPTTPMRHVTCNCQ